MNWSPLKRGHALSVAARFAAHLQTNLSLYGLIIIGIVFATITQLAFFDVFEAAPFFLYWPVVMLAGWKGGFGPGLFASLLAVVFSDYFMLPPRFSFALYPAEFLLLGLFIGITGFMSWLREQQRYSEASLHQSQQEMHITLASIGDGVIVTNADAKVTFLNAAAAHLIGWSEAEAVGHHIVDVFHIVSEEARQPVQIPGSG